jgi:hypothetical protein
MNDDLVQQLRAANPVPGSPATPPIGQMRTRLEGRSSPRQSTRPPHRWLVAVPLIAVAVVAISLAGTGGRGQFDVLAAVYRATKPGTGVFHVDVEESYSGKPAVTRFQYWQTISPRRERVLVTQTHPGRSTRSLERVIAPGGTWHYWTSQAPATIIRTQSMRHEAVVFDASLIQQAYRRKELHLVGNTRIDGRNAYRLRVVHASEPLAPPVEILVAAKTFVPIEDINYHRTADGRLEPGWVLRYRAYEELTPDPANVALTRMAAHAGARTQP